MKHTEILARLVDIYNCTNLDLQRELLRFLINELNNKGGTNE